MRTDWDDDDKHACREQVAIIDFIGDRHAGREMLKMVRANMNYGAA